LARIELISAAAICLLAACGLSERDTAAVKDALADSLAYVSESRDIHVSIIEEGLRKVEIRAPYGTSREQPGGTEMRLSGPVSVIVRDTAGVLEVTLRADSAVYRTRDGEFHFEGNVFAQTATGRRLTAARLTWFQRTGDIASSGFVRIVTPTDSIEGRGLTGRADLSQYVLLDLSGTISLDSDETEEP
jgi:LPS export ABC transporter protein LptC